MNKEEIMKILPHREPILLVDEVLEIGEDYVVAKKYVKKDEPVLKGHFPDYPIYPGVYIIEGLAQASGIMLLRTNTGKVVPLFLGIDEARFKKEVRPECELIYNIKLIEKKGPIAIIDAKAYVDNQLVAKAKLMVGSKEGEEK
ncbi:3-hydroxyacyl-ACP dehydratase FabZ [Fervidobacterium nodosum]|uniref:3-hydroxyacyl-[acyl-carrier-protein] dehydratase n=1 Tax=Fervidobacterium nodosum (strain ATCC 35602 / DSM 5306 / Rt17-B1) TaxID=381764 RepID=A7HKN5_FERNB|nr:3-hydroxyacyl-ACP dehydratase FabZ [Fervidobacterium nodosum]ABS60468.1 Beta-hydroxyacyl-(acyl-carrier-protein) dehydratase FabA/FabZ [Fervidobacterium nodosum Rt17-B1]PHJ14545.1 hydroxymyristoyl-ACP dehydratase [Fervidobacterium sp. SC_NGM5_G05]